MVLMNIGSINLKHLLGYDYGEVKAFTVNNGEGTKPLGNYIFSCDYEGVEDYGMTITDYGLMLISVSGLLNDPEGYLYVTNQNTGRKYKCSFMNAKDSSTGEPIPLTEMD